MRPRALRRVPWFHRAGGHPPRRSGCRASRGSRALRSDQSAPYEDESPRGFRNEEFYHTRRDEHACRSFGTGVIWGGIPFETTGHSREGGNDGTLRRPYPTNDTSTETWKLPASPCVLHTVDSIH